MHYNYLSPSISLIRVVYIVVALSLLSGGVFADTLSMKIDNIQDANGTIMISIGDASAFDGKGPNALQIILPARTGSVFFTTDALPPGTWAARVLHDVNGNNEMDSNMIGIPKEPWGMSNNARGNFGPPKFEDARFELMGDTALVIKVEK
jgi:uncharacterized protein (DUF2141 family)